MKLVFENELYKFYENEVTKLLNDYCVHKTAYHKPPLENYHALLAELKDGGGQTYVLYCEDIPVYDNPRLEAMGAHIDMLRLRLKR